MNINDLTKEMMLISENIVTKYKGINSISKKKPTLKIVDVSKQKSKIKVHRPINKKLWDFSSLKPYTVSLNDKKGHSLYNKIKNRIQPKKDVEEVYEVVLKGLEKLIEVHKQDIKTQIINKNTDDENKCKERIKSHEKYVEDSDYSKKLLSRCNIDDKTRYAYSIHFTKSNFFMLTIMDYKSKHISIITFLDDSMSRKNVIEYELNENNIDYNQVIEIEL